MCAHSRATKMSSSLEFVDTIFSFLYFLSSSKSVRAHNTFVSVTFGRDQITLSGLLGGHDPAPPQDPPLDPSRPGGDSDPWRRSHRMRAGAAGASRQPPAGLHGAVSGFGAGWFPPGVSGYQWLVSPTDGRVWREGRGAAVSAVLWSAPGSRTAG